MQAGDQYGVEVVPGVELSVTVGAAAIHLLGYFIDPSDAELIAALRRRRASRHDRLEQMVGRLAKLGMDVNVDTTAIDTPGRPHVAEAMVEAGHVSSTREAFQQYLGDGKPAHVASTPWPATEALALLKQSGGIGVLAHPGDWTSAETINALVQEGLDGLETVHPAHDEVLTTYYRQLAKGLGLVETGGSDFHAPSTDDALGRLTIPYAWVDRARARAKGARAHAVA